MIFLDLAAGESIFVDANTLIYHFTPHPQFGAACAALLQRVQRRELTAYTSTHDSLVRAATTMSRQFGLLSGDALVVAVMRAHGLSHLASHDADFDRVPGITRYAPA